ncbi:hypothetical protein TcasGA2_TC031120 [Tribolium castaneum]|uniref:Uncharacterized protein n=1 Tax=Tribolium castaneum TaxID=7070 RepID=A0A139W8R5_TRICA|nr:hypothetical protein TcasGA2_TC031120 [Tribolium castaneum]
MPCAPFYAPKYPMSWSPLSAMVFAVEKLALINFYRFRFPIHVRAPYL